MKYKYTIETFLTRLEKAAKTLEMYKLGGGGIRARKPPFPTKGDCYCPLTIAFPDVFWGDVTKAGLLSLADAGDILDASDCADEDCHPLREKILKAVGLSARE
jgi:hypothetical protein